MGENNNMLASKELSQHPAVKKARDEHLPKIHIKGSFTLAVGGDIIQTNPISQLSDPEVRGILDVIKNSDVAFANMESNFADYRNQEKHVGGLIGSKEVAADVKSMGFDLVARASNHSTGQGTERMLKDNQYLQEAGLIYAGTGINLEDARAPQFLETPKGRVGLVAMVMSQTGRVAYQVSNTAAAGLEMASYQAGNMNGLPGANFLRVTPTYVLVQEEFDALKAIKSGQNAYIEDQLEKAGKHNTGGKGEAVKSVFKNIFGSPKSEDSIFFNYQWYMAGEER
ncbi:CapA family protein, partial [Paenibacillus vulneris]